MADQIPSVYGLESIAVDLSGAAISLLVVTWIAALLRAYVRGYMLHAVGWDDWTLIPTLVAFTTQCAYLLKIADAEMHPDQHSRPKAISEVVTDTVAFSGCYALTCVFLKISLGLFFLRIFIERWQRNVIYAVLTVNTLYGITYFGILTFGCGDPSKFLIRYISHRCISIPKVYIPTSYVHTAMNATVDWIMALLPIYPIWNLQMPRIAKFWAYILLMLGATGSIVSLIRFAYVKGLQPGQDFFKLTGKFALYSTIEPGLGIAAVCLGTLRPLFRKVIDTTQSLASSSKKSKDRSNDDSKAYNSEVEMARLAKKARRTTKDGFLTFDESDMGWLDENEVTVTKSFTVKEDLESGVMPSRGNIS